MPHFDMSEMLTDRIDALLPQTQCRQCGYSGCRPYAEAVATGRASINQCPPGGEETIRELAALLGRAFEPLNPAFGTAKPPMAAVIDEAVCIGCTLCIQACPVDAIVGAAKLMHTVITAECTGCELCVPPCPVDCIAMVEIDPATSRSERAALARRRYLARIVRLEREKAEREAGVAASRNDAAERRKRDTIERVMQRARERLRSRTR
jgi:H+/Na+-translocating ferredoxin:NAD+ oxidoreductase subunit B